MNDLKYALRSLAKSPGYAGATILILALGIGGVTAMFSTLYTVMIEPLPYSEPERLVLGRATFSGNINPIVAGPDYVDYREQSRSFSSLEAYFGSKFEVTAGTGQHTERADLLLVSAGLFRTLGVNMFLGRSFLEEEGKADAPPVVIVSHAYWRKHFDSKTDVVGRPLTVDGVVYTLVGVTPPDFHFINDVDIWQAMRPQNLGPRRFNNWLILGRLRDGVSLAGAQSDVDVISARLERAYPDTNTNKALLLTPLQSAFTEQYRSGFGLLGGGAAAILLIACANAAGLLLARGASRHRELAVRAALGASHWQLMRPLLAEASLLAGAAGGVGIMLALWIQQGLLRLMPIEAVLLREVGLSVPVLLFVLATTLVTGLGFGLLPASRARRLDMAQDLKSSGRGLAQHSARLRGGLVTGQVAASFVLLVIAGLLLRSLTLLHRTDPGFDPRNLLTVEIPLPPGDYKDPQRTAFFGTFLEDIRSLPGVASAGAISQLPLRNPYNNISLYAVGAPPASPADDVSGYQRVVLPGYFKTLRIPLLAGRDIQASDTPESSRVVIISQELVKRLFPDRNPLGLHVVIDGATTTPWQVVGVVGDIKSDDLYQERSSRGTFYRAHAQMPWATMRLAVRTQPAPQTIVASLRSLLQKMDPSVPLSGPRTMEEIMANSTVSEKAQTFGLAAFSLLALTLAAVGIYGLLAYSVAQRQREIGIRMALGASRHAVAWSIVRQAGILALAGVGVGGLGALGATRLLRASLYGIAPSDPVAFAAAALVLLLMAGVASWLPARKATRVNPMEALRAD
jgi:predicted permease